MRSYNDLRASAKYAKQIFKNTPITVAEIGVHEGSNAEVMLDNLNIKVLYLIDPYELGIGYDKIQEDTYLESPSVIKQTAHDKLKRYSNIVWIQKKSKEASVDIGTNVDYVYIDGDHRYLTVREDIELYFPLIREGGILAGHDYHQPFLPDFFKGLTTAVDEFGLKYNYTIQSDNLDWWIVK